MKFLIIVLLASIFSGLSAQQHSLTKVWETDSIVAIPESVLAGKSGLYISLIDGGPWDADGKGGVAKLAPDGKGYDSSWVTGLDAPKGMGILGNRLFVADISSVVVIDVSKGKVEKKIAIDSAQGLNDITIAGNGDVFVSDSKTGKVWKISNDQPQLYLSNLPGINGLKWVTDNLYIGAGKSFVKADAAKQLTMIASLPEGIDGIEPVGNGDFVLTAWAGFIYYVSSAGKVDLLLDTHLEKKNTADIGYDAEQRMVYVPTFFDKKIVAYRLL
jgi:hypothetical protein